ncbi:hypothetical protein KIN20_026759, partial [Parelaphostrongylus tenuis]
MRSMIFGFLAFSCAYAISLITYWNEDDTNRLSRLFEDVLNTKRDRIDSLHYAISGLKLLNAAPSATLVEELCEIAKKADLTVLETLYHASALSGDLPNCTISKITEAQINKAAFDQLLEASMKADDSPNNLAWVYNAAALLDRPTAAEYFDKIKNLVSQANEIDQRFLQFDGGLITTANALHGILSLAELQGKLPAVTKDQMSLFTNYLLSRKRVFTEKSAFFLLSALGTLANNHGFVPVTVSLVDPIMADRSK